MWRPVIPLTWRLALAALAVFWFVAAVFLVLWWRAAAADARVSGARVCAEDEVFTGALCQAVVVGTVTKIADHVVQLDLEGRPASMPIEYNNNMSDEYVGPVVRVTLYKGEPIRIEDSRGSAGARNSPAENVEDYRTRGLFFFFGPLAMLAGCALAIRKEAGQRSGHGFLGAAGATGATGATGAGDGPSSA